MISPKSSASILCGSGRFIPGLAAILFMACALIQVGQCQTLTVLHRFADGVDGANPYGGVSLDSGGNLYGMTWIGGTNGQGVLYQLKRAGSSYTFNTLHSFTAGADGSHPHGGLTFSSSGALYGATTAGGYLGCASRGYYGCGVVFSARPSQTICRTAFCDWTISQLYTFQGSADGNNPYFGELVFDQAGNIYGTNYQGGLYNGGTVFKLTRSGSGWIETILHNFGAPGDGSEPLHGIVLDSAGNIYGTTYEGGSEGGGTVFQLVPSGAGWTENILASFSSSSALGGAPMAGLLSDAAGNLYGATSIGFNGSAVFRLSPSGGSWQMTVLYQFAPANQDGVVGNMVMDSLGNLYGATVGYGVHQDGMIFKLSPNGNAWTLTDLHDFDGGDGGQPMGDLTMDAAGNLYGTTNAGGVLNIYGVVWKLTP